jgi:type I restriction enzyme R subunit
MPSPTEHKSDQSRIIEYATEIGWQYVSQSEAESRRGFDASAASPREKARNASRFFTDTLFEKVKEFNPKFKDNKADLLRLLDLLLPYIHGNREFLHYLQGE